MVIVGSGTFATGVGGLVMEVVVGVAMKVVVGVVMEVVVGSATIGVGTSRSGSPIDDESPAVPTRTTAEGCHSPRRR